MFAELPVFAAKLLFLLKNYHFRRKITIFVANQCQRNIHFYSSTVAQAAVEE